MQPAPAVAVADDRVAVLAHALAHDGPDDRVQSGAVAATGQHSDSHRCLLCLPYPAASPRPRASLRWTNPTPEPTPTSRRPHATTQRDPREPACRSHRRRRADRRVDAGLGLARDAAARPARGPHARLRGADRSLARAWSPPGSSPAGPAGWCTAARLDEI